MTHVIYWHHFPDYMILIVSTRNDLTCEHFRLSFKESCAIFIFYFTSQSYVKDLPTSTNISQIEKIGFSCFIHCNFLLMSAKLFISIKYPPNLPTFRDFTVHSSLSMSVPMNTICLPHLNYCILN